MLEAKRDKPCSDAGLRNMQDGAHKQSQGHELGRYLDKTGIHGESFRRLNSYTRGSQVEIDINHT